MLCIMTSLKRAEEPLAFQSFSPPGASRFKHGQMFVLDSCTFTFTEVVYRPLPCFRYVYDIFSKYTDASKPRSKYQACVVPRPIGWISTVSSSSSTTSPIANLAPFSQFNNLTFDPPYVIFAANYLTASRHKDTVLNAESTGVFCWQLATYELREAVNATAEWLPPNVDEFEVAGLEKTWSVGLEPPVPMVKRSPIRFECEFHSRLTLPGNPPQGSVDLVIGRVRGIHIDDWVLSDGKIDVRKTRPIARLGYYEYTVVTDTFEMIIPGDKALLHGLEGSSKKIREWERDKRTASSATIAADANGEESVKSQQSKE